MWRTFLWAMRELDNYKLTETLAKNHVTNTWEVWNFFACIRPYSCWRFLLPYLWPLPHASPVARTIPTRNQGIPLWHQWPVTASYIIYNNKNKHRLADGKLLPGTASFPNPDKKWQDQMQTVAILKQQQNNKGKVLENPAALPWLSALCTLAAQWTPWTRIQRPPRCRHQ